MAPDGPPHLTTVARAGEEGSTRWRASCLCGWSEDRRLKREAVTAAEMHWLSMPLDTGEAERR